MLETQKEMKKKGIKEHVSFKEQAEKEAAHIKRYQATKSTNADESRIGSKLIPHMWDDGLKNNDIL